MERFSAPSGPERGGRKDEKPREFRALAVGRPIRRRVEVIAIEKRVTLGQNLDALEGNLISHYPLHWCVVVHAQSWVTPSGTQSLMRLRPKCAAQEF